MDMHGFSPARVCALLLLLTLGVSGQAPRPQPAVATKPVANSVKFGNVQCLTTDEVFETFGLSHEQWQVVDGEIKGRVTANPGELHFLMKKPFSASEFVFGFNVRSKWYQGAVLILDDSKFVFSRGNWGNAATLSSLNGVEKRLPGQVLETDQYHAVEIHYAQGEVTVYYDGKVVDKRRFLKHSATPKFFVGFLGYDGEYSFKDFFLKTKQVGEH
ncbi:MAG: hypothetical protein P4L99_02700 [Chthoniobacter sp.]|nr:hypothetical protein [Chthoniobacter sp.]